MSIVTKTGDDGTTGLVGGLRTAKSDHRIEAIGTVDELNAWLGLILSMTEVDEETRMHLTAIQHLLFRLGADLATPHDPTVTIPRIELSHIERLEGWINALEATLPELHAFILPGGSEIGGMLHCARAICRRAERCVVHIAELTVPKHVVMFLNRLSDFLFLLARHVNHTVQIPEEVVRYDA